MADLATKCKEELMHKIKGIPIEKIKEVLNFVYFLKAKDTIDTTQIYFYTRKWQEQILNAKPILLRNILRIPIISPFSFITPLNSVTLNFNWRIR